MQPQVTRTVVGALIGLVLGIIFGAIASADAPGRLVIGVLATYGFQGVTAGAVVGGLGFVEASMLRRERQGGPPHA